MMEMHSFQKSKQIEIPSPTNEKEISAQNLFAFLYEINEWIQTCPLIYRSGQAESDIVYALFADVALAEDDFWQAFGPYLAALHTRWQIDVFGTAEATQETVWMSVEENDGRYYAVQKTLSGQSAETVQSLCLRIKCSSSVQAEHLQTFFESCNWKKGIVVTDWEHSEFLLEEQVTELLQNSCFCYGSVFDDIQPGDYLQALNFNQKITLWIGFLKDGFDYIEFEWLYREIFDNTLANRIEWELSLHAAMQCLGYTIQISPNGFELYDGQLKRCYFNFNSSRYAERALLKILFPLNL